MSDQESPSQTSPEERVAQLFEAAGYDVSREVGLDPGTVDLFATPRTGLVRPRTYWKVWERCPQDLEGALKELDKARVARGADRALGVAMQGLPVSHSHGPSLDAWTTDVFSFRRLSLELSGVVDEIRGFVHQFESSRELDLLLPWRGRDSEGRVIDVVQDMEKWIREGHESYFILHSPRGLESLALVRYVVFSVGTAFLQMPEHITPLVWSSFRGGRIDEVFSLGWAIPVQLPDQTAFLSWPMPRRALVVHNEGEGEQQILSRRAGGSREVWLMPFDLTELEGWFQVRLPADTYNAFRSACGEHPQVRELMALHVHLPLLLDAMLSVPDAAELSASEWVVRVVAAYVSKALRSLWRDDLDRLLERGALEQFVLGRPFVADRGRLFVSGLGRLQWLEMSEQTGELSARFRNVLIRDYFVARAIVAEVRAGRSEILTRYQFPREYVLLFLAIIAPEVAAQANADRSAELRATIEGEVERRLQLTLAHMLRRSAGAVRSQIQSLRRRLSEQQENELQHEFSRLEEEVTFQLALAERTRLLREMPEQQLECITVAEQLAPVVRQLQEQYAQVLYVAEVDPRLRARASREGLREVLSCLLENAFQAVAFAQGLTEPRVTVRVSQEGDVIRIDVLDSGPGVAPADRERIFEPYVSTKKGGDKPLGTGMGLAIARRYAQHMGGRVALDARSAETCFYVQLVAWKD